MKPQKQSLLTYIDDLESVGKYTFLEVSALQALQASKAAFSSAVNRLKKKKRLIQLRQGFYLIIPLQYRSWGAPPADWFIDALMAFHRQPYYVGVLSAAALHGAAHQQPQVFQVVTTKPLRSLIIGRSRIEFLTRKNFDSSSFTKVNVPTGYMNVGTPETTAIDLLHYVKAAGYLNNVATVLSELNEKFDDQRLLQVIKSEVKIAYVQRLGYLLELVESAGELILHLKEWLKAQHPRLIALRPDKPFKQSTKNNDWKLYINEEVEPDL